MNKYFASLCASVTSAIILLLAPVSVAHATPMLLTCLGNTNTSYSPGVTNTTATTTLTYNEHLTLCPIPLLFAITSGTNFSTGTITTSCTGLAGQPFSTTYVWSDGETSDITFTSNRAVKANGQNQVIATGTVTAGLGSGSAVTRTITYLDTDLLACESTGGLQSISGTVLLEFGI
ncbi:hypothetical protein [Andreprevotia chitinilytica]|uniref:hypothetical protein n=1 Tax=Andreprevotia chitinilytica TaxID=396808 RepID=UPI0005523E81|nr:hypothetical protein [Andreprevotia chitinilytica]